MINDKNIEEQEKKLFSQLKPNYSKSKEDVWLAFEKNMGETQVVQKKKIRTIRLVWAKYAAVASIIIVVGLGLFARLYTIKVEIPSGKSSQCSLPDGSIVYLNAESSINYHPYWWSFNREVKLEGEAFFEVEKGEKFNVNCKNGSVEVLGTSFNVFDRNQVFTVFCKTGKVRVLDSQVNEIILKPGMVATNATKGSKLELDNKTNVNEIMSWKLNKFMYNVTPLTKVLEDFERHYGIKVVTEMNDIDQLHFTGLFRRDIGAEEALNIVSFSFELKVEQTGENSYLVKQ